MDVYCLKEFLDLLFSPFTSDNNKNNKEEEGEEKEEEGGEEGEEEEGEEEEEELLFKQAENLNLHYRLSSGTCFLQLSIILFSCASHNSPVRLIGLMILGIFPTLQKRK